MPGSVKIGGTFKTVAQPSVKIGGAWKSVSSGFVRIGGAWKQWFSSAIGNYDLIQTINGTGSSGSITFSSIPQTYKHLQIRYVAKNTSSATQINITINGVNSAVYSAHTLLGNGSTITSTSSVSQTSVGLNNSMSSSTMTNALAVGVIDLLDYSSNSKNTTIKAMYGIADDIGRVSLSSGLYNQTNPVTSLTLSCSADNFSSLTRFSIYGLKG